MKFMKRLQKNCGILLMLFLLTMRVCAAEECPGTECFSPGMRAMGEYISTGAPSETSLKPTVKSALFIPDARVMNAVLSGLTLLAESGKTDQEAQTKLTLIWGDDEVASAALRSRGEASLICLGGQWMQIPQDMGAPAMPASFGEAADAFLVDRFLRIPVERFEKAFAGWKPDERFLGFSPDGRIETALSGTESGGSRLTVSGALRREDKIWSFSGTFVRGEGDRPKDEASLELVLDDENRYALTFTAQQKGTARGQTGGTQTVTLRATLEGRRAGSPVDCSLTGTRKNDWTRKNGVLEEKISVTAKVDFRDRSPGQSLMQRGHDILNLRETIRCRTSDGGKPEGWTDEIALKIETDGGTLFSGTAALSAKPKESLPAFPEGAEDAVPVTPDGLRTEIGREAQRLAARIYARLDEKTKRLIIKGL